MGQFSHTDEQTAYRIDIMRGGCITRGNPQTKF